VVPGNELLLRLGEVERRAARLGNAADEEDHHADELRHDERQELALPVHDLREVERAAEHDDA